MVWKTFLCEASNSLQSSQTEPTGPLDCQSGLATQVGQVQAVDLTVCRCVTNLIREAASEPLFGSNLILMISERIRERLNADPQPTITFNLWCGEAAGPTEWATFRVEFFRRDWDNLRRALKVDDDGGWNEETLLYGGDLFEVSANAAEQEVLVVFW